MALYTLLLDYRGGTYISQITADSESLALDLWTPSIQDDVEKDLVSELRRDRLVQIEDTKNVWCTTAIVRDNLAVMNIVKTDTSGGNK